MTTYSTSCLKQVRRLIGSDITINLVTALPVNVTTIKVTRDYTVILHFENRCKHCNKRPMLPNLGAL